MHPSSCYDVAIVGGGPAGASAAWALARKGVRVVVIEKATVPRYKTCGGGVVRRAARLLPLDLRDSADLMCHRVELNFLDSDLHFEVNRTEPVVTMTMRSQLDARLLAEAAKVGAEILSPCTAKAVVDRPDGLEMTTTRGVVVGGFIIGCDGAGSRVARMAGWNERLSMMPACEWEVYVDDDVLERFQRAPRFDFGVVAAGYAWVFPKQDHLSIGVASIHPGSFRGQRILEDYMARVGVGNVQRIERHGYVIPARPRKHVARGRFLLAGDAAGLIDPVTGEGITFAIRSGQLAAEALLEMGFDSERVGEAYEQKIAREILPEIRVGRVLARVLYDYPRVTSWLFRRYGTALCNAVAKVISGEKTYRELLFTPTNYLKLLLRKSGSVGFVAARSRRSGG